MSNHQLTEGALKRIMSGETLTNPIMQVLGSKKIASNSSDKERYRLLLSDGRNSITFAMLATQASSGGVKNFSVIKAKKFITSVINNVNKGDTKVLLILDIDILEDGDLVGKQIGNPIPLADDKEPPKSSPTPTTTSTKLSSTASFSARTENGESSAVLNNSISQAKIINPIESLTPYHNKWVIKARVVNKSELRTWANSRGEGKLFSFDLIDETGEIKCTAFRDLADKFYNFIQVDKVYYFSKCLLKPANAKFNQLKNDYEMTLTNESIIEECLTSDGAMPQVKYNFVPIEKIATLPTGTLVDVIGVCKSSSDLMTFTSKSTNRELKKREIQLVDQSQTAIALTLWGSQAENFDASDDPVIVIKGAKVGEFGGGKNLSVLQNSQFKINPDIPDSYKIKGWFNIEGKQAEMKNVSERTGMPGFQTAWKTFKEIQENPNAARSEKGDYFQTMGTILLVRSERAVYKACPTPECNKKVIDMENGMYRCEKCNREFPNFKFRLLVSMNVGDWQSNQWVSLFANEAEKILGKTSEEIGQMLETNPEAASSLFKNVNFNQLIFKCRTKLETYNDEERLKTVVIKTDPINYEEFNRYMVEKINKILGLK